MRRPISQVGRSLDAPPHPVTRLTLETLAGDLPVPYTAWEIVPVELIAQLHADGYSCGAIATIWNTTQSAVRSRLNKHKRRTRPAGLRP